jgi:hypothetical protein
VSLSSAKTSAELSCRSGLSETVGNVGGDLIITITWRHRHAGLRTLARTFAVLDVHRDGDGYVRLRVVRRGGERRLVRAWKCELSLDDPPVFQHGSATHDAANQCRTQIRIGGLRRDRARMR